MKRIKLISLAFRNFKGLKEYKLEADGENADVYGDNATGKTTQFDGFMWLLFGKDSQNKADFELKTLDQQGKALHNLEHEVEGVLLIDGRRRTLRKVFTEKWTRKRGSATSEFTGHETQHFVDGVPVSQSEYKKEVAAIIDEDAFKLLTNPAYFNEVLKWQDRRKALLDICGDITDAEVIAGNKDLAALAGILGERTIEQHRKVIAARRAQINDELGKIPVRIDEAARSKPETGDKSEAELKSSIDTLRETIADKEAELTRIQTGGEVSVKEKQLREIEGELQQIKNDVQAGSLEAVSAKRREVAELRNRAQDTDEDIRLHERKIAILTDAIRDRKAEADRLRAEWNEVNNEKFVLDHHDDTCPACKQALPAEQVQAAHDKALADFNQRKSNRLEVIQIKGKAAAGEAKQLETEKAERAAALERLMSEQAVQWDAVKAAEAELERLQAGAQDVDNAPDYIAKRQEAETVRSEILGLRSSLQGSIDKARIELASLRTEAETQQRDLAKFDQARAVEQRIADLSAQEKALASEFEKLEHELHLTEEFIRTKVASLESKINSKFRYARFKLFEQQINGGLSEVCETTYEGVPYGGGLNNAARINVGLDIINTLSEHYKVTAPIFVDNAEAVTKLLETGGQQIRLIVSEQDKKLRVERAKMKEVV